MLNLGHLEILPAMSYWDITFWDHCLWADNVMEQQEQKIHAVLFPNIEFSWPAFCEARGLPIDTHCTPPSWRNAKCDVQALWTHIHHHRDVFVTSDGNFHLASKRAALVALGAGTIAYPEMAATLL